MASAALREALVIAEALRLAGAVEERLAMHDVARALPDSRPSPIVASQRSASAPGTSLALEQLERLAEVHGGPLVREQVEAGMSGAQGVADGLRDRSGIRAAREVVGELGQVLGAGAVDGLLDRLAHLPVQARAARRADARVERVADERVRELVAAAGALAVGHDDALGDRQRQAPRRGRRARRRRGSARAPRARS